jgi:hypothetical protein
MNQFLPVFEEESSKNDNCSGLFSHLSFRFSEGLQSITVPENKFEPKDISGQFFEEELAKELSEPINKIIAQSEKEKSTLFAKRKIFRTIKPSLEKLKEFNYNEINGRYFPFSPGIGIQNVIESCGYKAIFNSPHCISISTPNDIIIQINSLNNKLNEGKIKYQKKRETFKKKCLRKAKPDDIRKKIKARLHKEIKNIINANLKKVGSTKLFDFFPQNFVTNITVKLNKIALNHTYEHLIRNDLVYQYSSQQQNQPDLEKFKRNLDVLDYLDNNPIIDQLSYFNKIRKMKYKDLYKAYFLSAEFEKSIIDMYKKGEKIEYIESYINKSLNYINFFMSFKPGVKKCIIRINNESDTGEKDSQEN